ncbi:MAG TPA: NAD(P)H-dependent glycerol-3-phosphate dehydrogenase [Candidatus Avalokitesvara rifleensis]|uniref:NAD(P)H-dependent glycerol-3-phosphate dehydrogenase n=1 Tax=Candidatus Avalokitesvara rifleensis TaxID=3367620 RepID=UPI00271246DF|nr:NAD(P)H-dependent glycerol-3-phosphate dehydrogenase [Candidatus Brocadiales bacterium]
MKPFKRISVLGSGGWGTALSLLLHKKGYDTLLWGNTREYVEFLKKKRENVKYLPGVSIPTDLPLTSDLSRASDGRELIVVAVPTPYLRSVMKRFKPYYVDGTAVLSVVKGIENETLLLASQVIKDVLGDVPVTLMMGPSHAEEVARGLPTTAVVSGGEMCEEIQKVFFTDRFRVYTNPDTIGVEVGAAVKNVIAIAAGICEGLQFGDNTKAALITRGLVEISRLGVKMGGQKATFSGLTGLGDLITTCISPYGRNRRVGLEIGKGEKIKEVLEGMEQVAEGVFTTRSVNLLAKKHEVDMPICREIYSILYEDKDPRTAVGDLMMRTPKAELEELE